MLVAWMSDNNTKAWSEGLQFIQSNRIEKMKMKIKPVKLQKKQERRKQQKSLLCDL